MNRKKLYELKKNLMLDLKHHPDLEYDEEFLLNDDNDHLLSREDAGVVNVLFSVHGSYIFFSFFVFFIIDYLIDLTEGSKKRKVHNK